MQLGQHLWEFLLFLVILFSPLPLSFSLILIDNDGKEQPNLPHSLLVLLTSWCVIETCIGLFLGTIKYLALSAVIVSEFVVFLAGIILLIYLKRHIPFSSFHELLRAGQPLNKLEMLIVGSISFVGVIILERVMTLPITEYDSLWWKLPATVRFYQTASVVTWFNAVNNLNLANQVGMVRNTFDWHVLCALFLIPFREDFLVTLPQLIAWLILGLSVYLLSIKFSAMRIYALAASALVLTVPLCIRIVNTMHMDLPLASFFMASLYFAFSYNQTRSPSEFLLFLASLGMLLGIKTSGLIYGFLLAAAFIVMRIATIYLKKRGNSSVFVRSIFVIPLVTTGIFCLLFLGGFWYFKNLIDFGNPLGDVGVKVANITLFHGKFDHTKFGTLADQFDMKNLFHWQSLGLQSIARLQIPFLGMLAQVLVLPCALFMRKKQIKNETIIGLLALLISTFFLYSNSPYSARAVSSYPYLLISQSMRYGLPFIGVLGVGAAASATVTRTRSRVVVVIVLISSLLGIVSSTLMHASQIAKLEGMTTIKGAALVYQLRNAPGMAIGLILKIFQTELLSISLYVILYVLFISLIVWGFFVSFNGTIFLASLSRALSQSVRWLIVSIFFGLIITATFVERERRDVQRYEIYGSTYEYISNRVDQNQRIGYLEEGQGQTYLLYGKELNKEVLYTTSKSDKLSEWLDDLRKQRISFVAAGPTKSSKGAVSWLEDPNGPFVRVAGRDIKKELVLYRRDAAH